MLQISGTIDKELIEMFEYIRSIGDEVKICDYIMLNSMYGNAVHMNAYTKGGHHPFVIFQFNKFFLVADEDAAVELYLDDHENTHGLISKEIRRRCDIN